MADILSQEEIDILLEVCDDEVSVSYDMSQEDIYNLISDSWGKFSDNDKLYIGACETTKINEDGYVISVLLPGVSKEDILITNIGANSINVKVDTKSPFNIKYDKIIELGVNKIIKVKSVDGILYIYCKRIENNRIHIS